MINKTTELAPDRPLMTFALFAYNQERYIREAVDGALAQTYEPLEIILSDDCSSDRTFEIMHQMAGAYDGNHTVRVRQTEKNLGTLNHVLNVSKEARGEIIIIAAGDDVSRFDRCEKVHGVFKLSSSISGVYSSFELIDEESAYITQRTPSRELSQPRSLLASGVQLHNCGATAAYKNNLISKLPYASESVLIEDFIISLFLQTKGGDIKRLTECLVKARSHSGNIWGHGAAHSNTKMHFTSSEQREMKKAKEKLLAMNYIKENIQHFRSNTPGSINLDEEKLFTQLSFYDLKSRWKYLSLFEKIKFFLVSKKLRETKYATSRIFGERIFLFSRIVKDRLQK